MSAGPSPDRQGFRVIPVYRSATEKYTGQLQFTPAGNRVPVRIPLEVDNIWEWLRPAAFPSRRSCAFGSPSPALAAESGPPGGVVCRVLVRPPATVAQLQSACDARYHADIRSLPALLTRYEERAAVPGLAALRCGLLSQVRTGQILARAPGLIPEVRQTARYWRDSVLWDRLDPVVADPVGEIMFHAPHGYFLEPLPPAESLRSESSWSADSQAHMRTRATGSTS